VTLDPHHAYETTNLMIHANTYDTLVEYRPADLTQVAPRLADSWTISDDGLVYTFNLHPDVKFTSGNPVTAEDVRFSWTRLINLKGNPSFYADLVESVNVVDDLTVEVTLKEASPAFLGVIATPAMSVLDSKVVQEQGGTDAADADQTDKAKEWLDQQSAGSGPFIQTSWTPKAEIVLEANAGYWRGAPKVGKIIIKHVADDSTALQMLQRGDADIVQDLDTDLAEQIKADANLELVIGQTLNMNYLAMSPDAELGGPLADKKVRQAVAYAVDYEGIMALLNGYADWAPSIIPLGVMGVDPAMKRTRDLDKARELLAEAGYADGGPELDLSYGAAPGALRETVAAKLKADLEEAGMVVNLHPLEVSVYLSEMRAQKLPMALGGWTPDYLDPTMWSDYYSYPDRGIAFRIKYDSPAAAALAQTVATEFDETKRAEAVRELVEVLMDEVPFIMLWQPQQLQALSKDVQGFAFHPVHFANFIDLSK
jgi:peptide/nickel transport system substrate-binding protein